MVRACARPFDGGTCFGLERCTGDGGWSACDAPAAAAEVCNGRDDDCDGLTDGLDPSLDVSGLAGYPGCTKGDAGVCTGAWECSGGGWLCTAPDPQPEVCNGRDDDCNGRVDEPFVDSSQRYVGVHDCAQCGFDCQRA